MHCICIVPLICNRQLVRLQTNLSKIDSLLPSAGQATYAALDTPSCSAHNRDQARFLCVFDGHGGSSVAEYVARALPAAVDAELVQLSPKAEPLAVENAISRAFVSLDAQLSSDMMKPDGTALRRPGSCALLAVERHGWLHVAHAGDCRAVVTCGNGDRLLLVTQDHNAKEAAEQLQLRAAHPGEDDVVVRSLRMHPVIVLHPFSPATCRYANIPPPAMSKDGCSLQEHSEISI